MEKLIHKDPVTGELSCNARDFDKFFPLLHAYEETGMSPDDIREFAADVANQFGYHSQHNGRLVLTHGGLSTLEWAFDILGWENPHPDPENECQYEGCHHYASCGTPTKDGYKRVCGHHFAVLQANARAEAALAKDNNVPGKTATDTNVGNKEEEK